MTALNTLNHVFGFDDFRPGQQAIVDSILAGDDVMVIMPTGGGKSLCYQLPAIHRDEGLTVVISPLIALMRDQVAALQAAGVAAAALSSSNSPDENTQIYEALEAGRLRLLYLAPERLNASQALLAKSGVRMVVVDEAHCVSQWGHDFRPDYLTIGDLRDRLGGVQMAAFTATADPDTQAEIAKKLFTGTPTTFLRGFDRPNLSLAFAPKNRPRDQLIRYVKARKGQSGIVYALSRSKTETLAKALRDEGIEALPYHAGLDHETRTRHQDRFQREDGIVICGTIAFGMGIDKPDVRFVFHADLPKSVEAYYQEIGRAGRDGAPAETLTLYGVDDIAMRRQQIDEGAGDATKKRMDHQRFNALLALAEAPVCRRQTLLRYFGEDLAEPCGNCDLCHQPPKMFDASVPVQKALSAIYRTEQRFGAEQVISVLRGEINEKTKRFGHDALSVFGIGQDYSKIMWRGIMRQMLAHGLVTIDNDRHGAWMLTEQARPILRGEQSISLREDAIRQEQKREKQASQVARMVPPEDEALLSELKSLRRRLADEQNVPAYVVFPDRSLIDMVMRKPGDIDGLATCHGVGAKKLERYGEAFLSVLNGQHNMLPKPGRRQAALSGQGALFDELQKTAIDLKYGRTGTDKPLVISEKVIAKLVELQPDSEAAMTRIPGVTEAMVNRFGIAFITVLADYR
ncbi:MAG: DNA helicase RecQ [Pseudomonadota bacterium]